MIPRSSTHGARKESDKASGGSCIKRWCLLVQEEIVVWQQWRGPTIAATSRDIPHDSRSGLGNGGKGQQREQDDDTVSVGF
ncbi:hypothetical protein OIU78_009595 [Salix suchowensis]|nr:hypothetical protein OIU78_009595 [Salix suchowensis]